MTRISTPDSAPQDASANLSAVVLECLQERLLTDVERQADAAHEVAFAYFYDLKDDDEIEVPMIAARDKSSTFSETRDGLFPQVKKVCNGDAPAHCLVALPLPLLHPLHTPPPPSLPTPPQAHLSLPLASADNILADLERALARAALELSAPPAPPSTYVRVIPLHERLKLATPSPSPLPAPLPKRWRTLSPAQVFSLGTRAAERAGGEAFSLNLSPNVENTVAASLDPAGFMAARIARALKNLDLSGMPFGFTLETNDHGRLHLHGILLPGDADPAFVKRALMQAGGKLPGRAASRQLSLKPLTDSAGWVGYTLKDVRRTINKVAGDRLTFTSPALKKLAQALHGSSPAPKKAINTVDEKAAPAHRVPKAPYSAPRTSGRPDKRKPVKAVWQVIFGGMARSSDTRRVSARSGSLALRPSRVSQARTYRGSG